MEKFGTPAGKMNLKEVQDSYLKGKKVQGLRWLMPVGNNVQRIPIPGSAKRLLGIRFIVEPKGIGATPIDVTTQFTMTLNNDVICYQSAIGLFSQAPVSPDEYFKFQRKLNGNDTLSIETMNPVADSFYICFNIYFVEQ
jgi:hypothetical protein